MRFRKLRIAWSAFSGLSSVLLIVLWVRSYGTLYWCYGMPHNGQVLHLHIAEGLFILFVRQETPAWEAGSLPREDLGQELNEPYTGYQTPTMMSVRAFPGKQIVKSPLWLAVVMFLVCAFLPW